MAESAALLVDEVFPAQPVRQWVLSFPDPLGFLFASRPAIMEPLERLLGHSITYRIAVGPHAGVAARADERKKLERLCRYITRPAVSEMRLSLLSNGKVRYKLKTPYRDGTTQVIFEPFDFSRPCASCARDISAPCTSSTGSSPQCPNPGST